jgi:RNA polymerase sigma-32 factor
MEEIIEQSHSVNFDYSDVGYYVSQARKHSILSREDEKEIAIKALAGDRIAAQKIVESNLLLVVKIAHEYRSIFNNLNDLIQEGNIGLLRSVNKYDPERGYRFSTYAGWWIRSMMLRYIFNNSHMIKPGTTNEQKKLFYNLRKEQRRLGEMGIDADAATVAQNLDVSEEDVIEMDCRLRNDIYLDSPVSQDDDDGDKKTLAECISSSADSQPDVVAEKNDFRSMLRRKLDIFAAKLKTDRHREIFYKRIVADEPQTLQELGDGFGITKERTRQIEEEITARLKKYLKNCISQ